MSVNILPGMSDQFVDWAQKITAGLSESNIMLGVWAPGHDSKVEWAFKLQIGHCLTEGKPLVLIVEQNRSVPEKLLAAATVIEYFDPAITESVNAAVFRALEKMEIYPKH